MFIDKNSIQIKRENDDSYTNISEMLTEAKYSYNKLWSSDSGRNLAGKQSGTLIGIFPKIVLTFRRLSKSEMQTIVKILDAPRQKIHYYDPYKKDYVGMVAYTGDYEYSNKSIVGVHGHKNEPFSVSFISVEKR